MRKPLLPIVLMSLILGLAACGGGGEGGEDEAQIEENILTSLTSTDPTKCTKLETLDFVEQNADASGSKAIAACREAAADTSKDAKEVDVSEIAVDGKDATANVGFEGGGLDQQVVSIALVEEGGTWKLDQITGFVELDDNALAKTMEGLLEESAAGVPEPVVECFSDEFRGISKERAKELLLGKSTEGLSKIVQSCQQGGG